MEVAVTSPNRDLHSGFFGGAVANPINILSQIIDKHYPMKKELKWQKLHLNKKTTTEL